jgi:hypothetical protein
MADSKPPRGPSKRPSTAPAKEALASSKPEARATKAPPTRKTMEVQLAWLEPTADAADVQSDDDEAPVPSSRKRPPRLPGAAFTLPPMPVVSNSSQPPRRNTINVEMNWVDLIDEETGKVKKPSGSPERPASARPKSPPSAPPSRNPSSRPLPAEEATKPKSFAGKAIRREEE